MEWIEFVIAGTVFLAAHRIPTMPSVRTRLVRFVGERGFLIGYSLLSLVLLCWLILTAGHGPYVELWGRQGWQTWVPALAMPVVCLLVVFSIGAPNPLSFGGGAGHEFDPGKPGIAGVARHGLLWAIGIWSAAHIVPNGNLAHIILFGGCTLFSLYSMRLIDKRKQRNLGSGRWKELAQATSFWPFESVFDGRWRPVVLPIDAPVAARFGIAIVVYFALLWSHEFVIGVSPWPDTSFTFLTR